MTKIVRKQDAAPATSEPMSESAAMISMLERMVTNPSTDVDKFERFLAMKERLDAAESRKKFNAAVAAAKSDIPPIFKNKTVDFTGAKGRTTYRHEDFAEIARVVDPVLSQHGLSYRYRSSQSGGKLTVTCILSHTSGHAEETTLQASDDHSGNKNDIQAIGSSATYLQRYTLKLALGLASSSDDDGKKAGDKPTITDAQVVELRDIILSVEADEKRFCNFLGCEKLSDIPADQFDKAKRALQAKGARR